MKIEYLFCIFILISGCSIYGHYSSNPKSSIASAGYEIVLTKNNTFHIQSWTDTYDSYLDSNGNMFYKDPHYQGFGKFVKMGDSLELIYLNEDSIAIEIIKTSHRSYDDFSVSVISETGKVITPILSLKDSSKYTIETVFNKNNTHTEFQDSVTSEVFSIGFDMHMFRSEEINIPLENLMEGRNLFKYKTYNGFYPKGTKIKLYCKRTLTGIRYGKEKRWLAKK